MIDLPQFYARMEIEGQGIVFTKDGADGGITAVFELEKGIHDLYLSPEERIGADSDLEDCIRALPRYNGKRGFIYQLYYQPDFDFSDVTRLMEKTRIVDNDKSILARRMLDDRIAQVQTFSKQKRIMRHRTYLICKYLPGGGFVHPLLAAVKNQESLIKGESIRISTALKEFDKIKNTLKPYAPRALSQIEIVTLIQGHFLLPRLSVLNPQAGYASSIFSQRIEFKDGKTTIDNPAGNILESTYSASVIHGYELFGGSHLQTFPGDYSITISFSITDNRRFLHLLSWARRFRTIAAALEIAVKLRKKANEMSGKYATYTQAAEDDVEENAINRVKAAIHLTLRTNEAEEGRESLIEEFSGKTGINFIKEKDRNQAITMGSAMPLAYKKTSPRTVKRDMTIKETLFKNILPLFKEPEGTEIPIRLAYTTQGIYKIDSSDPRVKPGHELILGGTTNGKTFWVLDDIISEYLRGTNIIYMSSKGECEYLCNVLGGKHTDIGMDGKTKLYPFTMPKGVWTNKNWYADNMTTMVDTLQYMTNTEERKDLRAQYYKLLQKLLKDRDCISVTEVAGNIEKMGLKTEARTMASYTFNGEWGNLFDGVGEDVFDAHEHTFISINTRNILGVKIW